MTKLIYKDKLTNEHYGDYEQTIKRLNDQPTRQNDFKDFTEYYNTHGWYGGYCGDLHTIDITCKGSELKCTKT